MKFFKRTDEFYVGYFPEAPPTTASIIRKLIIVIGIVTVLIAVLTVVNQRAFSTSQFDYGASTTIEGYYHPFPVPHVKILHGKSTSGEIFQNVLLVGVGKSGVREVMQSAEKMYGEIKGRRLKISGYLIYGDGRTLLQINDVKDIEILNDDTSIDEIFDNSATSSTVVVGEIVDPKCFFGVMKPGEGKAHRSCAIRCISGGIPPVLKTVSNDYFLLTGKNLEPVNDIVLPVVGDRVELTGDLLEWNDWKILKIDREHLRLLAKEKQNLNTLLAMEKGMSMCINNQ
jgi:hypothetical protein